MTIFRLLCQGMGQIKRYLFIVLFILFTFFLSVLGLFLDYEKGFYLGLLISAAVFVLASWWSEKIILIFLRARYVGENEDLINQIRNFCLHLKIKEVKIYWSGVFVNNVYFTSSYFGTPSIVIGKNVYKTFNRNELNTIIYASLLKVKSKEAAEMTMSSILSFIWLFPLHLLYIKIKNERVNQLITMFYLPITFMRRKVYIKSKDLLAFDAEVVKFKGLSRDYASAIFKIASMEKIQGHDLSSFLVDELVVSSNAEVQPIRASVIQSIDINTRLRLIGCR